MRFEIKKLVSSKYMIICFLILIVFFAVFAVNAYEDRITISQPYERLLSDISDNEQSDKTKLDLLKKKTEWLQRQCGEKGQEAVNSDGEYGENLVEDMILYSKAYEAMERYYVDFPENRKRIIIDSLYNISDEQKKEQPDTKIIEENRLVVEKYNRKIQMKLCDTGDVFNTLYYFDNTIWDYAMIAFVIMLTVRMFTLDYSSGAYQIVFSTAGGKKKLFIKQYFTVCFAVSAVILVFSSCQLVFGYFFFGVKNFNLPIQMVDYFEFCPFLITIGEYFLIKLLCKVLLYITIISVTALLSISLRKAFSTMSVSLMLSVIPLILITYYFTFTTGDNVNALNKNYGTYKTLQTFVPQSLLNIKTYFNSFDYVDLHIMYVPRIVCCVAVSLMITVGCFLLGILRYAKPKR